MVEACGRARDLILTNRSGSLIRCDRSEALAGSKVPAALQRPLLEGVFFDHHVAVRHKTLAQPNTTSYACGNARVPPLSVRSVGTRVEAGGRPLAGLGGIAGRGRAHFCARRKNCASRLKVGLCAGVLLAEESSHSPGPIGTVPPILTCVSSKYQLFQVVPFHVKYFAEIKGCVCAHKIVSADALSLHRRSAEDSPRKNDGNTVSFVRCSLS